MLLLEKSRFNSMIRKIAILTSGGDAPGMNACIRAVVRTALNMNLDIYGVERGYAGLINGEINRYPVILRFCCLVRPFLVVRFLPFKNTGLPPNCYIITGGDGYSVE